MRKMTFHFTRMRGALPPLSQYAFMARCSVKKHRENFTFTLASMTFLH